MRDSSVVWKQWQGLKYTFFFQTNAHTLPWYWIIRSKTLDSEWPSSADAAELVGFRRENTAVKRRRRPVTHPWHHCLSLAHDLLLFTSPQSHRVQRANYVPALQGRRGQLHPPGVAASLTADVTSNVSIFFSSTSWSKYYSVKSKKKPKLSVIIETSRDSARSRSYVCRLDMDGLRDVWQSSNDARCMSNQDTQKWPNP